MTAAQSPGDGWPSPPCFTRTHGKQDSWSLPSSQTRPRFPHERDRLASRHTRTSDPVPSGRTQEASGMCPPGSQAWACPCSGGFAGSPHVAVADAAIGIWDVVVPWGWGSPARAQPRCAAAVADPSPGPVTWELKSPATRGAVRGFSRGCGPHCGPCCTDLRRGACQFSGAARRPGCRPRPAARGQTRPRVGAFRLAKRSAAS